jgi:hypothetical protein
MNIFSILASGKNGMREETMSVLLGYLLTPEMDHGLGIRFLRKMILSISE